jgi:uncharacterized membrane protein YfcA
MPDTPVGSDHQEKSAKDFPEWPVEPDNTVNKRVASRLHFYLAATYVIGMLLAVCEIGAFGGNPVLLLLVPLGSLYVTVWEYPYIMIPVALIAFVVYAYGRAEQKEPIAIVGALMMVAVWLGAIYWCLQHPEFFR